jgi:hypothetical protein
VCALTHPPIHPHSSTHLPTVVPTTAPTNHCTRSPTHVTQRTLTPPPPLRIRRPTHHQAPTTDATSRTSFFITRLSTDSSSALQLDLGVFNGNIRPGNAGGGGGNESWGSWIVGTQPAPKAGLRAGQNISVAVVSRILPPAGASGTRFELTKGSEVTIVTVVLSNVDTGGTDPRSEAERTALAITDTDVDAMRLGHTGWWSNFWNRSAVSLPSQPTLERFWFNSLYTSASSARAGGAGGYGAPKTAPGLMSIWAVGGQVRADAPTFCAVHARSCNLEHEFHCLDTVRARR